MCVPSVSFKSGSPPPPVEQPVNRCAKIVGGAIAISVLALTIIPLVGFIATGNPGFLLIAAGLGIIPLIAFSSISCRARRVYTNTLNTPLVVHDRPSPPIVVQDYQPPATVVHSHRPPPVIVETRPILPSPDRYSPPQHVGNGRVGVGNRSTNVAPVIHENRRVGVGDGASTPPSPFNRTFSSDASGKHIDSPRPLERRAGRGPVGGGDTPGALPNPDDRIPVGSKKKGLFS